VLALYNNIALIPLVSGRDLRELSMTISRRDRGEKEAERRDDYVRSETVAALDLVEVVLFVKRNRAVSRVISELMLR
jgi:hypothetical protein